MSNVTGYNGVYAFHPGYYIEELIEDMGVTQSEFAKRLCTTDKNLSKLIKGDVKLSSDMAAKLAKMTGISFNTWLNLQNNYEKHLVDIEQQKKIDEEQKLLELIDSKYLIQLGVFSKDDSLEDKLFSVFKFLKVSSLNVFCNRDIFASCRTTVEDATSKHAFLSNVFIQIGLNSAYNVRVKEYNVAALKQAIPQIRILIKESPNTAIKHLKEILADCGVALVLLPHLKNSGISGAVKWFDNNEKVMLLLSDKRKDMGSFWFSLFHEISHILDGKKKKLFITADNTAGKVLIGTNDPEGENRADIFAQNTLIPSESYNTFVKNRNFSENAIINFARMIDVSPDIVIGRLKHDQYINWNVLQSYTRKYKFIPKKY